MLNSKQIYELLLDYGNSRTIVKEVLIGLTWTLCHSEGIGLAMSPAIATRILSWSGTLVNQKVTDLAYWLSSWQPYEATIAMAAINSVINSQSPLLEKAQVQARVGSDFQSTDHARKLIPLVIK